MKQIDYKNLERFDMKMPPRRVKWYLKPIIKLLVAPAIKKYKPKTLFFGHHHKNRYFKISHTDCYNIYGLGIFNIEKGKVIDWLCYGF